MSDSEPKPTETTENGHEAAEAEAIEQPWTAWRQECLQECLMEATTGEERPCNLKPYLSRTKPSGASVDKWQVEELVSGGDTAGIAEPTLVLSSSSTVTKETI
ncbi:hypothetical protein NDU88_009130 [Pleurodeles waltl]|uniref:Uncharacterized protein n=1 Tax=Pleurodeles waltl TaxID=8319 RepID=A0AAV7QTP8_PLEWA|nr:hypothetical protein NDU88_009130 [Pleurodeles waltl]